MMSAATPVPTAIECKFDGIHFMPAVTTLGKTSVDVYWTPDSMSKSNRLKFSVATEKTPARAQYALDTVREDGNALRRTQKVIIEDPEVIEQLKILDDTILDAAVQNALQWFKKPLDRDAIAARYNPVLSQDGDKHVFKFKVKCPGHEVPTKLHNCTDFATLTTEVDGARIEDLQRNALLMPIVNTLGLYFIGGGMWGMSFQSDELLLKKADLPHPLAAFKTSIPFNIVKDANEVSLKRSFDELEEEISLDAKEANNAEVATGGSPSKKVRVDEE